MYKIEIVDAEERLHAEHNYNDKHDMIIAYNKIKNNVGRRYKLHGLTLQVFEGQDLDNLKEIRKYRISF